MSDPGQEDPQAPKDLWLDGGRDRLSSGMAARGFSQRDLAERIGITGSAVAQWMGRESSLADWWRLRQVAQALGVRADWILGLPDEPAAPAIAELAEIRQKVRDLTA